MTNQGTFSYINNHTRSASCYTFTWTPPAAASGTLRFYVAGMAARNTRDSRVYTAVQDLTPAGAAPTLRSESPVVLAAGFRPMIASGAWIAIFGENLAGASRIWNAETEVVDISPTQINVQAPDDEAVGPVEVKVTTPQGTATGLAEKARYAPGLFAVEEDGKSFAAALLSDGSRVGAAGTLAVRAGDLVSLFGTGFGDTIPAVAAGVVMASPAALDDMTQLQVRIGGVEAKVLWAGLISAGLYQINIEVPAVANGDQEVIAERNGALSASGVYLSIAP